MADGDGDQPASSQILLYGSVLAGAEPFKFNGNINSVFRGQVLCSDGSTVTAFIKDLDPRELLNELLAAVIAVRLRLPVPQPIVARAEPGVLPVTKNPLADGDGHVVFASADSKAKPVLQVIRDGEHLPEVIGRIAKWDGLGDLYGFDAWLANIDRHRGNLLLGGGDEVWMIDHGHCFTGPAWSAASLAADGDYRNRLREWLTPNLSAKRRAELVEPASRLPERLRAGELETLARANGLDVMLGEEFPAMLNFLETRAGQVPRLSTAALDMLI